MRDRTDTKEPPGAKVAPLTARGRATRGKILNAARRIFEQMAAMDGHFRQLRLERARFFAARNTRMIEHLQASGHADSTVSAEAMSLALSSMVSRTAQLIFNFGLEVDDVDELVEAVVQIWVRSLGLPHGDARA